MDGSVNHERLRGELHALTGVAKALTMSRELPELLQGAMDEIARALDPAEFGVVLLWDQSEGLFRPYAACGQGLQDVQALREIGLREGESVTGKVYAEGQAWLLSSLEEVAAMQADMGPANRAAMQRALGLEGELRSVVATPVTAGDKKYGVLVLGTRRGPTVFTKDNLPFVRTLADLIALAIDRSMLETGAATAREARQTDRLRAEVMATLSHELRTPLAAIKGYSTALLLDQVDWPADKQREFLRLIDEECDNLQTMIDDILDSALIDVGQFGVNPEPVRLPLLAREIAEEMQRRTEDHHIIEDFPLDFPIVDADPRRIRQVLRNILDNAIKYSPGGGMVVIRGEVRRWDVVISIADQGVGISPEDLIPLFEKYFRVKSPTGYYVPGTGLGLPVARAIVEAHGGHIWAQSKVEEGTTLYFSLPREGAEVGDQAAVSDDPDRSVETEQAKHG